MLFGYNVTKQKRNRKGMVIEMKQIRKNMLIACLSFSLLVGSIQTGLAYAEPVETEAASGTETVTEQETVIETESEEGTEPVQTEEIRETEPEILTETEEIETEAEIEEESETETGDRELAPVSPGDRDLTPVSQLPPASQLRVPTGGFLDVQDPGAEYYDAVYWAAENDYMTGADDGYFGVNEACTRQQFVLYLWRLAGKPAPNLTGNPFSDVSESDAYYQAVLWAAEQGILSNSSGSFGVGQPCKRAEIAVYFWKLAGRPLPQTTKNPFKDVSKNAEYYNAVLWAAENNMAGGCDDSNFRPQDFCLKQYIAVALYGYSKCDPETFYLTEMPQPAAEQHLFGVSVSWNPVPGAEDYRIYRKTESGSWTRIGDTWGTSYLDRTPEENTTYYYTVRCVSADGRRFKSYYASPGAKITTAKTIVRADQAPGPARLAALQAEAEEAYRIAQENAAQCRQAYELALAELEQARQDLEAALADLENNANDLSAGTNDSGDSDDDCEEQIKVLEAAVQAAQEKADAAAEALDAALEELQNAELALQNAGEALAAYIPATGIHFEEESVIIPTQESVKLPLVLEPENACEYDVIWMSSDESVAAVDECGMVTALTRGEAQISAVLADGTQVSCSVKTRYYDVADPSLYYYDAVYWAADQNITKGYGNVYFGPDDACTREQMVMFLWRMAGQPAPLTQNNPFSDVKKSAYYYNAVLWAVDQGITNGYDDGTFGVGKPCLREHLVTFLWRLAGKPLPQTTSNSFSDIKESAYYYDAVLWAAENAITKGYSDGSFGPGKDCLRQHTVTFLYRYSKTDPATFYLSEMPKVKAEKRMYDVKVTWTAVPGAELYRIYRKPASGSWVRIADTRQTQYVDGTAAPKTTYYYTVRCISADGSRFKSGFQSPGAKVTTPSVFPHTGDDLRQLLVENAYSYVGTKGQSVKHKHILDVFNQVQPDGAPMYLYSPWCAAFASAMSIEVFGENLADKYFPLSYNCGTIIRKAVTKDIWVEKDSYTPKPGDWIIYDWDDSGSGEDITGADHVGIIKSVSGKTITVIEGNMSNSCDWRTIQVNGRYIRGYVTPNYDEIMKHL